jgi:hypothetical protein
MRRLVTLLACSLLSPLLALTQIPRTLSYQAVLNDNAGVPKPDGAYTMTFRLYDAPSGGVEVWSEIQTLQVKRGLFNAVLGSVTPFADDLAFTQPYWLSLEVSPDPELVQRIPLTAVGYALGPWGTNTPVSGRGNGKAESVRGAVGDIFYAGSVGIGANSVEPGYRLDVNGQTLLRPGGNGGGVVAFGTPNFETGMTISGNNRADVRFDGTTLKLVAGPGGVGPPPSSNGVTITTDGNVGIGTAIPLAGYRLDVGGQTVLRPGGNGGGTVAFGTPNFETGMTISGNNRADVRFDGTSLKLVAGPGGVGPPSSTNGVAITTAGNVGIGTATPSAKLEVIGRTKTGSLEVTAGSDLAEPFETETDEDVEPGSVMVIDAAHPGKLRVSEQAYDSRVAGISSGAGGVKPGITLQQDGLLQGNTLVAIAGRVYCRADARSGAIEPGDLLTTSALSGHAMKATDRERAHGAIIGKAMTGLKEGTGLVLVLVNLQ